ncbi:Macoilin [Armadillidium vulgare]|nr:Macoilin [Armadillidium vulgare]
MKWEKNLMMTFYAIIRWRLKTVKSSLKLMTLYVKSDIRTKESVHIAKQEVEFGFSSDNPLNQFFESASIVSWRILSYKGVCKGALMKLWKWDVNSLQKSFQENIPTSTTQLNDEKLATKEPGKVDFDIVSKDENFVNLFDDKDELDTLFPDGNKFSYNDDYDHKNNPLNPTIDDNSGSFKTMDSSEGASLKIHNRHNRNLPIFSTSHKTKRFYEHPIIHKHNGQQVSSNHGSLKMESSFSNLTKNFTGFSSDENSTTSFSRLLPPAGYQLQKLQEVLVLFSFNGSDWATHELGSMIVYQLCQERLYPIASSLRKNRCWLTRNR